MQRKSNRSIRNQTVKYHRIDLIKTTLNTHKLKNVTIEQFIDSLVVDLLFLIPVLYLSRSAYQVCE